MRRLNHKSLKRGEMRGGVEARGEAALASKGDGVRPCTNSNYSRTAIQREGLVYENTKQDTQTFSLLCVLSSLYREISIAAFGIEQ